MKRLYFLIAAATFLALVGGSAGYYWQHELSPTAKGLKVLRSVLFDPESSQLQNVEHFSSTGATCGTVNAKNRMGGYVGFTRFIVTKSGEVLLDPKADTESGSAEAQLAAVDKQLAFVEARIAHCPQVSSAMESSPK